jgi:hypothetical protein
MDDMGIVISAAVAMLLWKYYNPPCHTNYVCVHVYIVTWSHAANHNCWHITVYDSAVTVQLMVAKLISYTIPVHINDIATVMLTNDKKTIWHGWLIKFSWFMEWELD